MLLLHRLTPFVISLIVLFSLLFVSSHPMTFIFILPIVIVIAVFLFGRLAAVSWRQKDSWWLVVIPFLFILSSVLLFLLTDDSIIRLFVIFVFSIMTYFYAEHLFRFVHLPSTYQVYSLQNSAGIMAVLSVFFLSAAGYALLFFARVPLVLIAIVFGLIVFILTYAALWIAKVEPSRIPAFALGGSVLGVELFVAISYLPIIALTSGALLAVLYYTYLGLCRASLLAKLSRLLIRRYLILGAIIILAIILTAEWI